LGVVKTHLTEFLGERIMQRRKGFTLIELMVVILIVAILAAVAIPIMRGRIDAAKWTEGKSMAGTLATALRAYAAEKGPESVAGEFYGAGNPTLVEMGFATGDLTGTYFSSANYSWTCSYPATGFEFTINVTAPLGINSPANVTLNQAGDWVETAP
jgi:prepilin-type N-terminal cleavage/methylation domain-containing protein